MFIVKCVPVTVDVTADIRGHADIRLTRRTHVGLLCKDGFYNTPFLASSGSW